MIDVLDRIDQTLVTLFEPGSTDRSRRRARRSRLGACVAIGLTGIALLLPNLAPVVVGGQPGVAFALSALGVAVCLGLVVASVLLYRSGFSTPNAVRIAGWNFLGLVVLGGVLLAHGVYRDALGAVTTADALAAGNVLAISAAAHVIIGVHDARRVRAQQLAREREKFAILSRVLRHNLRNDATVLIGQSDRLANQLDDQSLVDVAKTIRRRSEEVGDLATKTKVMVDALERRSESNVRLNVSDVVDAAVADITTDTESVSVDVADDLWVWADTRTETALVELIENAVEHGGSRVRVTADDVDGTVTIRVADDGSGVPEDERAVVTGQSEITQLTHGSGLGLWVARSVAESAGGQLTFDTDDEWTIVSLVHERAAPPTDVASQTAAAA